MMRGMPEFKPTSLDQRVERALAAKRRTHFSQADWDFENVNWTLDEAIYHDAAPSLHPTAANCTLVKNATTGALSDGRLITWARSNDISHLILPMFRNQAADGGADYQDAYLILVDETYLRFARFVGGAFTEIGIKDMTWVWAVDTWYKLRFTWWTSVDRLYVRTERWTGTEWITLGGDADTDFEDTDDRWKDETVNRCGFYFSAAYYWIDDLEVWG